MDLLNDNTNLILVNKHTISINNYINSSLKNQKINEEIPY